MRGVFLNQLALSQHESGLWKVKLSSAVLDSYGGLIDQLKNYRANRDKILDNVQFLDMISGLKQELSFSDLLKELISWELTYPEESYPNFRNYSRYNKLSGYAHSEEKTHDISRLKKYFGNDDQKAVISESSTCNKGSPPVNTTLISLSFEIHKDLILVTRSFVS